MLHTRLKCPSGADAMSLEAKLVTLATSCGVIADAKKPPVSRGLSLDMNTAKSYTTAVHTPGVARVGSDASAGIPQLAPPLKEVLEDHQVVVPPPVDERSSISK
jgi:hypothetical protein